MMRGLKTMVFAAFAALAVGCGGTEMPADFDGSELGTQESGLTGSCNGILCGYSNNSCCNTGDGVFRCTTLGTPCGTGGSCPSGHVCMTVTGGNYCKPISYDCRPMD